MDEGTPEATGPTGSYEPNEPNKLKSFKFNGFEYREYKREEDEPDIPFDPYRRMWFIFFCTFSALFILYMIFGDKNGRGGQMSFIWGLIVGIGVATVACLVWWKMNKTEKPIQAAGINNANFNPNPNVEIRQENLVKLEEFISGKDKITNDEVQAFLSVSDATAERYLQALETQGALRQVGADVKNAYYQKI